MSAGSAGGWNQRVPPGVARCTCRARRADWAMLHPDAQRGCCERSCCTARLSVIIATREEIAQLRTQCYAGAWRCPRCGEPVSAHHHNFHCLDQSVKRLRAKKQASGVRYGP